MKVICIIPARGGSKGVPNKNLKNLNGVPLIQHSIDFAKKLSFIDEIIISSDSSKINNYCERSNVTIIPRPGHLAKDSSLIIDAIRYTIKEIENRDNGKIDYVFLMEPTSPIRCIEDFEYAINSLKNGHDSVASFTKVDPPPNRIWKIQNDVIEPFISNVDPFLPRQMHADGYILTGQIYGFERDLVIERQNTVIGPKLKPIIIKQGEYVDIDHEIDFYIAEGKLKYLKNENN